MKRAETSTGSRVALAAIFMLGFSGLALAGFYGFTYAQRTAAGTARQKTNEQLGLPLDYPADVMPIYQGAKVKDQQRDETKSTTGEAMDRWSVTAETAEDKDKVYDYYNDLLLGKGMSQTMYASVPSGRGVTYANEQLEIELTVEKKSTDKLTQIEIKLSRLKQ